MASQYWLFYVLIAFDLILFGWLIWQELRIKRLLKGKDAKDLEDTIKNLTNDIDIFKKMSIEKRLKSSVSKVETVRFNAYADAGGNQSFATTFLDEEGNGVVISSLYSRERSAVFSKPIKNYNSLYTLLQEEKEVLDKIKPKESK